MDQNNELLESNSSFINAVDKMVYWSKLFGVLSWIAAIFDNISANNGFRFRYTSPFIVYFLAF